MSLHHIFESRYAASEPEREFRIRRGAKALVSTATRVLLVQEAHATGDTFWTLPGGGRRPGESVPGALVREVTEELGCRCVVGGPVDSFWYAHSSRRNTVTVYDVRECSLVAAPTPVATEGILDCEWVRPESLPTTTLPQVRTVVEAATDP